MSVTEHDRSVRCWDGHDAHCQCEATIPDTDPDTMRAHGWGFMWAFDPAMPEGVPGAYYACPEHKEKQ